jgi:hypothetical protein
MNAINTNSGGPIVVPKIIDINVISKSNFTNDHGENLGKVEYLMFDLETGKLAYLVISFGGFPNRTKLFAVPWELLNFSHHDKKLILNIPREILLKAPGNDTLEQVTANPDFSWLGEIFEYYSDKTAWERKREEQRASEVLNAQQKKEEITKVKHPAQEAQS